MPIDDDQSKRDTPIPAHTVKGLVPRVKELESDRGKIAKELSAHKNDLDALWIKVRALFKRVEMVELKQEKPRDEQSSQTDISMRPGGFRVSLKNPSWIVVVCLIVIAISVVTIAIKWLTHG